jgi:hypothetical protein
LFDSRKNTLRELTVAMILENAELKLYFTIAYRDFNQKSYSTPVCLSLKNEDSHFEPQFELMKE